MGEGVFTYSMVVVHPCDMGPQRHGAHHTEEEQSGQGVRIELREPHRDEIALPQVQADDVRRGNHQDTKRDVDVALSLRLEVASEEATSPVLTVICGGCFFHRSYLQTQQLRLLLVQSSLTSSLLGL